MNPPSNNYYYTPIPGSKELITLSKDKSRELLEFERASKGRSGEFVWGGEVLHSGLEKGIPVRVFDELMPLLNADEQAVLGHLIRLSYGEGADWVRIGMKDLMARTHLSRRQLLKTLAGLTEKGIIKPLHRDIRGTLYKVYTVQNQPITPSPQVAPSLGKKGKTLQQLDFPREKPLESPINEEVLPTSGMVLTMREIAEEFFKVAGLRPSDLDFDIALSTITSLLEDGFTREEVRKCALFLAEKFGKKADITKMPYYISQFSSR